MTTFPEQVFPPDAVPAPGAPVDDQDTSEDQDSGPVESQREPHEHLAGEWAREPDPEDDEEA